MGPIAPTCFGKPFASGRPALTERMILRVLAHPEDEHDPFFRLCSRTGNEQEEPYIGGASVCIRRSTSLPGDLSRFFNGKYELPFLFVGGLYLPCLRTERIKPRNNTGTQAVHSARWLVKRASQHLNGRCCDRRMNNALQGLTMITFRITIPLSAIVIFIEQRLSTLANIVHESRRNFKSAICKRGSNGHSERIHVTSTDCGRWVWKTHMVRISRHPQTIVQETQYILYARLLSGSHCCGIPRFCNRKGARDLSSIQRFTVRVKILDPFWCTTTPHPYSDRGIKHNTFSCHLRDDVIKCFRWMICSKRFFHQSFDQPSVYERLECRTGRTKTLRHHVILEFSEVDIPNLTKHVPGKLDRHRTGTQLSVIRIANMSGKIRVRRHVHGFFKRILNTVITSDRHGEATLIDAKTTLDQVLTHVFGKVAIRTTVRSAR